MMTDQIQAGTTHKIGKTGIARTGIALTGITQEILLMEICQVTQHMEICQETRHMEICQETRHMGICQETQHTEICQIQEMMADQIQAGTTHKIGKNGVTFQVIMVHCKIYLTLSSEMKKDDSNSQRLLINYYFYLKDFFSILFIKRK
jgi:hypothetical protein